MNRYNPSRRKWLASGLSLGVGAILPGVLRAQSVSGTASSRALASGEQIKRVVRDLARLGDPIDPADAARLTDLAKSSAIDASEAHAIFGKYVLIDVVLDRQGVGHATRGSVRAELRERGWRSFLVRVDNRARLTGPLTLISRTAIPEGDLVQGIHDSVMLGNDVPRVVAGSIDLDMDYGYGRQLAQWMGYRFGVDGSTTQGLEGYAIEYLLLQLYSQQGGAQTAAMAVGTKRLEASYRQHDCTGFTAQFDIRPAVTVDIRVRDADRQGATASILIRDGAGRIYPAPAHRIEPDLGYQPQIYRADGESIRLPAGRYTVLATRGPEYVEHRQELMVSAESSKSELAIDLERWIHPEQFGWYSGDPHIHPEGQHYGIVSKYGLTPETMIRQVRGEALNVGSVLIWTGGYYYEKQFLTGHVYRPSNTLPFPEAQRTNNASFLPRATPHDAESLIRYDVEQAAFPSNRLGHPIFLCLKHHDFPGAESVYDWPSWNLPIFQWAQAQGAVSGYAHVGRTTDPGFTDLPDYAVPAMDDIGGNECLVDITHGVVDFIAGCKNQAAVELNFWYHLLNCGFRIPLIGETDFVGWNARVGAGRTYAQLDEKAAGDARYEAWAQAIRAGKVYLGDGRSHLIDFRANGQSVSNAPLELSKPARVELTARVAARLEREPFDVDERLRRENVWQYWHIERARIGATRTVPLEVIVNGRAVARREILADGQLREMSFTVEVETSSWIALRILPSSHTGPVFVQVDGRPVRVSRRSAQWCLECVHVLWEKHAHRIREAERARAAAAWEHARAAYRQIISECELD
jgi:hypothetical protein